MSEYEVGKFYRLKLYEGVVWEVGQYHEEGFYITGLDDWYNTYDCYYIDDTPVEFGNAKYAQWQASQRPMP